MRAWYDIAGNDISARQDAAGIHNSQTAVEALIETEVARGIAPPTYFPGRIFPGRRNRTPYCIATERAAGRRAGALGLLTAA